MSKQILQQQEQKEGFIYIVNMDLLFKPQEIKNTINPSIQEIERFAVFLNKKFKLGLDFTKITFLLSETKPTLKGYFAGEGYGYKNGESNVKAIVLSVMSMKETPYETIAHELAHFYNNQNEIKDCSSNQYHNKHFKVVAERLLLVVERVDNKGFAYTKESEDFFKMLREEYKPNEQAFNIDLKRDKKTTQTTRNLLYTCDCGIKVRCANKNFNATCDNCNTKYILEDND